jgi:hypothetical protein
VSLDVAYLVGLDVDFDIAHPVEFHEILSHRRCAVVASKSSGLPVLISHFNLLVSSSVASLESLLADGHSLTILREHESVSECDLWRRQYGFPRPWLREVHQGSPW